MEFQPHIFIAVVAGCITVFLLIVIPACLMPVSFAPRLLSRRARR